MNTITLNLTARESRQLKALAKALKIPFRESLKVHREAFSGYLRDAFDDYGLTLCGYVYPNIKKAKEIARLLLKQRFLPEENISYRIKPGSPRLVATISELCGKKENAK